MNVQCLKQSTTFRGSYSSLDDPCGSFAPCEVDHWSKGLQRFANRLFFS